MKPGAREEVGEGWASYIAGDLRIAGKLHILSTGHGIYFGELDGDKEQWKEKGTGSAYKAKCDIVVRFYRSNQLCAYIYVFQLIYTINIAEYIFQCYIHHLFYVANFIFKYCERH